jgi:hypothetical protein
MFRKANIVNKWGDRSLNRGKEVSSELATSEEPEGGKNVKRGFNTMKLNLKSEWMH